MNRINDARWLFLGLLLFAGCGGVIVPDAPPLDGGKDADPPAEGGAGGDAAAPGCTTAFAEGIEVAESDIYGGVPFALGYPSYAIDGCRLLYVAREADGSGGELRLRDLATALETVLEGAASKPRRPAARGGWMAWEATEGGVDVVRAAASAAEILTMKGPFDHAGEPRVAADAVVFTGWLGPDSVADTDVFLFEPGTSALTPVGKGPGQQRFADVSATHVAWSDFVEDADGTFNESGEDAADIVVLTRAGGAIETRKRAGKQAFPLLGAPLRLVYLDWGSVHPEPKFSEYDLRIGDLGAAVEADVTIDHITTQAPYVRPAALGGRIEWVQWPFGAAPSLLWRPADLSKPAEALSGLVGEALYSPAASDAITLVGVRASGKPLTLAAFPR